MRPFASIALRTPLLTSSRNNGSVLAPKPTAGAVLAAGVVVVPVAAVLFPGALASFSSAIAVIGRSAADKTPAQIRVEMEIIELPSLLSQQVYFIYALPAFVASGRERSNFLLQPSQVRRRIQISKHFELAHRLR